MVHTALMAMAVSHGALFHTRSLEQAPSLTFILHIMLKGFILPLNPLYLSMLPVLYHKPSSYKIFRVFGHKVNRRFLRVWSYLCPPPVSWESWFQFGLIPPLHALFPLSCDCVFTCKDPFFRSYCVQSEFGGFDQFKPTQVCYKAKLIDLRVSCQVFLRWQSHSGLYTESSPPSFLYSQSRFRWVFTAERLWPSLAVLCIKGGELVDKHLWLWQ